MALFGPYLVVGIRRGIIVSCWFHTTKSAAERREERVRASHHAGLNLRTYNLADLLLAYDRTQERDVEELERMSQL